MKNEELAFDLTINTLERYAKKCIKDKDKKMMNPVEATYLMTNSLATALLYKAEDYEEYCKEIIIEAIEDAYKEIKETKGIN